MGSSAPARWTANVRAATTWARNAARGQLAGTSASPSRYLSIARPWRLFPKTLTTSIPELSTRNEIESQRNDIGSLPYGSAGELRRTTPARWTARSPVAETGPAHTRRRPRSSSADVVPIRRTWSAPACWTKTVRLPLRHTTAPDTSVTEALRAFSVIRTFTVVGIEAAVTRVPV